jgi:hypothetical protein
MYPQEAPYSPEVSSNWRQNQIQPFCSEYARRDRGEVNIFGFPAGSACDKGKFERYLPRILRGELARRFHV